MKRKAVPILVATFVLVSLAPVLLADAAGDLAAGQAALAAGDVPKAIGLLESAAQGLPQSVEAHAALGRAYLLAGQLDKALARFRTVLRLSPDHAEAKGLVESLTAQARTFDQKLAQARSLMGVGAFVPAGEVLRELLSGPLEPAQRLSAQLALAEVMLWQGFPVQPAALKSVMEPVLTAKGTASEGPARVLAALALVSAERRSERAAAADLVKGLADLPAPWRQRAELVRLLLALEDRTAAEVSAKLADPLAAVPPSSYRAGLLGRVVSELTGAIHRTDEHGVALAIAWPMLSSQELPEQPSDLVGKPVDMTGGWVVREGRRVDVAGVLAAIKAIARKELAARPAEASLLGLWLAGEYLRHVSDETPDDRPVAALWLGLVVEAGAWSYPPPDRKQGEPLSRADELQRTWLTGQDLARRLTDEASRERLVAAAIEQINRYQRAGDLKTGLARFVGTRQEPAKALLADAMVRIDVSAGPAHQKLVMFLGDKYAELGRQEFLKAAASGGKPAVNLADNIFHQTALVLYRQLERLYPAQTNAAEGAAAIANCYAGVDRWDQAQQALAFFYELQKGNAGTWALARLKVRQVEAGENKLLAAHRRLAAKLDAGLAESLAAVIGIVKADPSDANKAAALNLAAPLVDRYKRLDRSDLAEAVIAATSPAETVALADWALLARADLLDSQAAGPLALAAAQFGAAGKLALSDKHAAELKLLGELVDKFPASAYVPGAIDRVTRLARAYQTYRAFDVAAKVLQDFVKARPKIDAAERLLLARLEVLLAKSTDAFSRRPDKEKPPEKLLAEHAAAIDAMGEFLKACPTVSASQAVLYRLMHLSRTYGQVGAWGVSREVLKRLGGAAPDFRHPGSLRLLEAATYLGELDPQHGLSLLTPPAAPEDPLTRPPSPRPGSGRLADGREKDDYAARLAPRDTSESRLGDGKPGANTVARAVADLHKLEQVHEVPGEALAMIRQSEQQQARRLALLNEPQGKAKGQRGEQADVILPAGAVLSEAEMKRQDAAADAAYAILIELVKARHAADAAAERRIGQQARGEILWLVGFFEGRLRADRAVALIEKFLADQPADPERVSLAYQAVNDQLVWAGQRRPTDRIDQAWIDSRHELFEQVLRNIEAFVKEYTDPAQEGWVSRARMLAIASYEQEAGLVAQVSAARAAGLLARAADELLALADSQPKHAEAGRFPARLWKLADRLTGLGQRDQAIYVLGRLVGRYPTEPLARQALMRIGGLYAAELSAPLRAVETYQELLALDGDAKFVYGQIFSLAQQLAGKQRYLEALHVYAVFVDSFPGDQRAAQALQAIGQTHQDNGAWPDALKAYQRILDEYPGHAITGSVKLAMAECQIHLSQWKTARKIYEECLQQYGDAVANQPAQDAPAGQPGQTVTQRIEVLKSLDRYQTLLADKEVTRNKDDAQFQIGRIVLERLDNKVKAVSEFRKVVAEFPKSDQADDAQFEIGKALLALGRLDEARSELLKVPTGYPTSPLADDALYLLGQSYEQQAQQLAAVTSEKAKGIAFEAGQRGAYKEFQHQLTLQTDRLNARRDELKKAGKGKELELEEAYNVYRYQPNADTSLSQYARIAQLKAETESALQVANRQDRINEAYRQAVGAYERAAKDFPLGDATDESLLRMAEIYETQLKDRPAAMETYQRVVKFFPGTPVAENAAWKVAKFHEQEGKYNEAVAAYRDFIRNYPASSRVADAQFAMAEALEQLGRWVEAMDAYQVFRDKFASHAKAPAAQEQIQWIKAYRK